MKLRLATPAVLVDVGRLPDLSYIEERGDEIAIGALARHHELETIRAPARAGAAARACRGTRSATRRCATAARWAASLAHGDPASDLPAVVLALGGTIVAAGTERRARDRGRRLLRGLPRDRARARRDASPRSACRRRPAPAGRSRSSTAAPRTGRSSASPRSATATTGVALVNMGSTPLRADRGRGRSAERCVGRRRGRARGRGHRAPRPTSTRRPSTAGTSPPVLVRRALEDRAEGTMTSTFGAGSFVGVAGAPGRRPDAPAGRRHLRRQPRRRRHAAPRVRALTDGARATSGDRHARDARAMPGVVAVYTADDLEFPERARIMQLHPARWHDALARGPGALRRRHRRGRRRRDARRRRSTPPRPSIVDYEPLPAVDRHGGRARVRRAAAVRGDRLEHRRWAARGPTATTRSTGADVVVRGRFENQRDRGRADGGRRDRGGPRRRRRRPRPHRATSRARCRT